MRKWINLIEAIEDQKLLTEVYMLVQEYVRNGEWRSPTQFDSKLRKLMSMIPRPDHSLELYRALRLTDEQLAEYRAGTLVLHDRLFSSWTKSLESVHRIAQTKGSNVIILKQEFSPEHIVIDVPDFYEEHEFTRYGDFPEYHNYVKIEQEVIVFHSGEIKLTPANCELWKAPQIDPPMIGDKAYYHDEDEDGMEIDDVDYEQPYADRNLFTVTLSDGDQATVRSTGPGEWEIVNLDIQEGLTEGWSPPTYLYHGTYRSLLPSIREHGLSSEFSRSSLAAVFLAIDEHTARQYDHHHADMRDEWVILGIDTGKLDMSLMGPDNYELPEMLEHEGIDKEWDDCSWEESLDICGQCAYHGVIPPEAISGLPLTEDADLDLEYDPLRFFWYHPAHGLKAFGDADEFDHAMYAYEKINDSQGADREEGDEGSYAWNSDQIDRAIAAGWVRGRYMKPGYVRDFSELSLQGKPRDVYKAAKWFAAHYPIDILYLDFAQGGDRFNDMEEKFGTGLRGERLEFYLAKGRVPSAMVMEDFKFKPLHSSERGEYTRVMIDVERVMTSWKHDHGFYFDDASKKPALSGRYERFGEWVKRGEPIGLPLLYISPATNEISFGNGRHRFVWLRDHGVKRMPVMVTKEQASEFKKRFG